MKEVQARVLGSRPPTGCNRPGEMLTQIRNALYNAKKNGHMVPKGDIAQLIKLTPDENDPTKFVLTGGTKGKDFRRDEARAGLIRDDLAWLHFTITLSAPPEAQVEVLGYDFEIVFPEAHTPPWVRFDLNLPDHPNEARELRSHVHPGNDDLQLPAPVMTPLELLELYIERLRPRDPEHRRQ